MAYPARAPTPSRLDSPTAHLHNSSEAPPPASHHFDQCLATCTQLRFLLKQKLTHPDPSHIKLHGVYFQARLAQCRCGHHLCFSSSSRDHERSSKAEDKHTSSTHHGPRSQSLSYLLPKCGFFESSDTGRARATSRGGAAPSVHADSRWSSGGD